MESRVAPGALSGATMYAQSLHALGQVEFVARRRQCGGHRLEGRVEEHGMYLIRAGPRARASLQRAEAQSLAVTTPELLDGAEARAVEQLPRLHGRVVVVYRNRLRAIRA
jgi:hypothetical protein